MPLARAKTKRSTGAKAKKRDNESENRMLLRSRERFPYGFCLPGVAAILMQSKLSLRGRLD